MQIVPTRTGVHEHLSPELAQRLRTMSEHARGLVHSLQRELALNNPAAIVIEMRKLGFNKCPCCSGALLWQPHRMSSGLLYLLEKLVRHVRDTGSPYFTLTDIKKKIEHSEYSTIANLRYFGIVARMTDKESGNDIKGSYVLTKKGYEFFMGEATVPEVIYAFKGKLCAKSEKEVTARDIKAKGFSWEQLVADYKAQLRPEELSSPAVQTSLFDSPLAHAS